MFQYLESIRKFLNYENLIHGKSDFRKEFVGKQSLSLSFQKQQTLANKDIQMKYYR